MVNEVKIALIIAIIVGCFSIYFLSSDKIEGIPITFARFNIPALEISIEDKKYLIQLDLGSHFLFLLDDSLLSSLNKRPYGIAKCINAKDELYESSSYIIPKLKIGGLELSNIITTARNNSYKGVVLWDDKIVKNSTDDIYAGTLGKAVLELTNLLLDFPNSSIFPCDNNQISEKLGFSFENAFCIPFELHPKGLIIMKVTTDLGLLHLALDTGSTQTLIKPHCLKDQVPNAEDHGFPVFTTSHFTIGEHDFGNLDLLLYDITPELNFDGLLGMDFLRKQCLYIDYLNRKIYIKRKKP